MAMVCSAIVSAHGGTMKAENLAEGGAQVSFTLPLADGDNLVPEEMLYGD